MPSAEILGVSALKKPLTQGSLKVRPIPIAEFGLHFGVHPEQELRRGSAPAALRTKYLKWISIIELGNLKHRRTNTRAAKGAKIQSIASWPRVGVDLASYVVVLH
jgi:hypothetical protein